MNGYPDGCSQADHDRAFGESLSEPPDVDVVRLDCGHYDTEDRGEWIDGKLICSRCVDDPLALKPIAAKVQLPTRPDAEVA